MANFGSSANPYKSNPSMLDNLCAHLQFYFRNTNERLEIPFTFLIKYQDRQDIKLEIGVPCKISDCSFDITPYLVKIDEKLPDDYERRKREICFKEIIDYKLIYLM